MTGNVTVTATFNSTKRQSYASHQPIHRVISRASEIASLDIARLLNVCKGAVAIYRHRIRKKLGITTKTNLLSHLLSLAP